MIDVYYWWGCLWPRLTPWPCNQPCVPVVSALPWDRPTCLPTSCARKGLSSSYYTSKPLHTVPPGRLPVPMRSLTLETWWRFGIMGGIGWNGALVTIPSVTMSCGCCVVADLWICFWIGSNFASNVILKAMGAYSLRTHSWPNPLLDHLCNHSWWQAWCCELCLEC